jgi:hypothetical protein
VQGSDQHLCAGGLDVYACIHQQAFAGDGNIAS